MRGLLSAAAMGAKLERERRQWKAEKQRLQSVARRSKAETGRPAAQLESERGRSKAETGRPAAQLESERALWLSEAT